MENENDFITVINHYLSPCLNCNQTCKYVFQLFTLQPIDKNDG